MHLCVSESGAGRGSDAGCAQRGGSEWRRERHHLEEEQTVNPSVRHARTPGKPDAAPKGERSQKKVLGLSEGGVVDVPPC